jgi:hypothetical protein
MAEIDIVDVRNAESTRRWLSSRQDLWGASANSDALIETLTSFCQFAGKSPDEMVDDCLKPGKTGETLTLRTRARRQYMDLIEQFEASSKSRDQGNIARSFLIHNGIAMNPGILS